MMIFVEEATAWQEHTKAAALTRSLSRFIVSAGHSVANHVET
jgi:hypothetical protein